ncbi:MAG: hypothetical protein LUQ50_12290 [Methanospirillum sp.]|uniref:hypothetical protein n=1 Tax=Methanospirillum sp. TaxID=45200 RepID=UPI002372477E|nr:hypothetical protein [Methanospirillum sp.]MDD1729836.1 hypothetical protein [Methanospirillum sp.]
MSGFDPSVFDQPLEAETRANTEPSKPRSWLKKAAEYIHCTFSKCQDDNKGSGGSGGCGGSGGVF